MKTICEALIDEIHYPLSKGFVENVLIKRGLNGDDDFGLNVSQSDDYRGAVADCLCSLLFSVNFSEADRSVGSLSSEDKKNILQLANSIYTSIGEKEIKVNKPKVYIGL